MAQIIKLSKPKLEVADIIRQHIKDYRQSYHLWPEHCKVISDFDHCRTAYMGGHLERYDNCGTERIMYHSCRNWHCPKCQQIPREKCQATGGWC